MSLDLFLTNAPPPCILILVTDQLLHPTTTAVHVSLHVLWSLTGGLTAIIVCTFKKSSFAKEK